MKIASVIACGLYLIYRGCKIKIVIGSAIRYFDLLVAGE
jgi:hypothetical protein